MSRRRRAWLNDTGGVGLEPALGLLTAIDNWRAKRLGSDRFAKGAEEIASDTFPRPPAGGGGSRSTCRIESALLTDSVWCQVHSRCAALCGGGGGVLPELFESRGVA